MLISLGIWMERSVCVWSVKGVEEYVSEQTRWNVLACWRGWLIYSPFPVESTWTAPWLTVPTVLCRAAESGLKEITTCLLLFSHPGHLECFMEAANVKSLSISGIDTLWWQHSEWAPVAEIPGQALLPPSPRCDDSSLPRSPWTSPFQ